MPDSEYLRSSEQGVLSAMVVAYDLKGTSHSGPLSTKEILEAGKLSELEDSVASTPITGRSGGWTVFDFGDRVLRCLNRLAKKGMVRKLTSSSPYYWEITDRGLGNTFHPVFVSESSWLAGVNRVLGGRYSLRELDKELVSDLHKLDSTALVGLVEDLKEDEKQRYREEYGSL